jgi:anti-sigma B factor antagonist
LNRAEMLGGQWEGNPAMEIDVQTKLVEGIPVLHITGELDLYTSPKLRTALESLLIRGHQRLVVNLLKTTYLDSTGLSILTAALKKFRDAGGNMALVFEQPQIDRMFTITGLNEIFPIYKEEAEAIAGAKGWQLGARQV